MNSKKIAFSDLFDFSDLSIGRADISGRRPTREASSLATYSSHAQSICRRSNPLPNEGAVAIVERAVHWFLAQDGTWSKNTIKAYRAALYCLIERATTLGLLDAGQSRSLEIDLQGDGSARPKVRTRSAPPRTSARKRKSFSELEGRALMVHLKMQGGPTSRTLGLLLHFGPALGLRFIEFLNAELSHQTLVVRCAKATNGRAVAPTRSIDLAAFSNDELIALGCLLRRLRRLAKEAGSVMTLHYRLAKALTRACAAAGIPAIALYTLRHQCLATAKRTLQPVEVAALAGHKTTRTAAQHYASRRTGWKKQLRASPTADVISLVAVRTVNRERSSSLSMHF